MTRYIFTVTAGRSGQMSLTRLLSKHVPDSLTAFEEPNIDLFFKGRLGQFEHRFRRRFVETHELLGRGKVLQAFAESDDEYLQKISRRRLRTIRKQLISSGASVYIDVSKYFARGLHQGFLGTLSEFSILHLVRDPLKNMRSFLNRDKNFFLDNCAPNSLGNQLKIESSDLAKGELYLWAWCEMYLRFLKLSKNPKIDRIAELRTDELTSPAKVAACLDSLGLAHDKVTVDPIANTNVSHGFAETRVSSQDVDCYRRFVRRIPPKIFGQISYLQNYDPETAVADS